MNYKNKVDTVHHYNITAPKDANKRWITYILDEKKLRKKIVATREQDLYLKLYQHYFINLKESLETLFPQWVEKRKSDNISDLTVRRNQNHWKKYYLNHKVITTPLAKITPEQIENFFHQVIRENSMTLKELSNMKFIFVDMMKFASRRKVIQTNPFKEAEIKTYGCLPASKQAAATRIYLPREIDMVFHALNDEIVANPKVTDCYAIFLLFKLGLRIGELVALREIDIDYANKELHVCRTETQIINSSGHMVTTVVTHTKKKSSYGDRFIPLNDYELAIIEKVKSINTKYSYEDADYLFVDNDGRTKIREIDYHIRKVCNKCGIEEKSAHDIRRTVASRMFDKGIPVEVIRDYLGHSDIQTTWSYIYNTSSRKETKRQINDSLKDFNGLESVLKCTQKTEK
jgi:integrase